MPTLLIFILLFEASKRRRHKTSALVMADCTWNFRQNYIQQTFSTFFCTLQTASLPGDKCCTTLSL